VMQPRGREFGHRKKPEPFLVESGGRSFKQINGIWYEVLLAPVEATAGHVWDVLLSRVGGQAQLMEAGALKSIYGRRVRAVGKRQLKKKEIRRLLATLDNFGSF